MLAICVTLGGSTVLAAYAGEVPLRPAALIVGACAAVALLQFYWLLVLELELSSDVRRGIQEGDKLMNAEGEDPVDPDEAHP